jgi:hypothetical protein
MRASHIVPYTNAVASLVQEVAVRFIAAYLASDYYIPTRFHGLPLRLGLM